MAEQLKALAGLSEVRSSSPRTHMAANNNKNGHKVPSSRTDGRCFVNAIVPVFHILFGVVEVGAWMC